MVSIRFFIVISIFLTFSYSNSQCLRYGVIPYVNNADIEKSYLDWKKYLESKLNRCIDIKLESSYGDIISSFSRQKLDFAFVGPFSYVLTKKSANVEPIVKAKTKDGGVVYRSLMVSSPKVAKELEIKEPLRGLEGMKILKEKLEKHKKEWIVAFTDESSTSGYAVPVYYMKKVFMPPFEYFKKVIFIGNHEAAQMVVKDKVVDISFSAEMFYRKMLEKNLINQEQNRLIWISEDIPKSPIIVNKNLQSSLKQDLQNALVTMPDEFIPKLNKEIGYVSTDEKEYKIIEEIYEYIKN